MLLSDDAYGGEGGRKVERRLQMLVFGAISVAAQAPFTSSRSPGAASICGG